MGKGKGTNINGPPSEVISTPVNNVTEIDRTAVDRRLQRIRRNKSDPTEPMLSLFALNDLPEAERNTVLWNPCDPVSMEGRCWRSMFTSEPPLDCANEVLYKLNNKVLLICKKHPHIHQLLRPPKSFENFYEGVSSAVLVHENLR